MDLDERVWSQLQVDLVERVLSFLSVPDLCRFRAVCKRWNELVCNPSFHDLCDKSRERNAFLFVTRYGLGLQGNLMRASTSFLDVDDKKWYSIKVDEGSLSTTLAMNDGLMCESHANFVEFVVYDPFAKHAKRRVLPTSPVPCSLADVRPTIVMGGDPGRRSFKVVIIDNNVRDPAATRLFIYASSGNEWRGLRNPPEGFPAELIWSATILREHLYVVFANRSSDQECGQLVILSYNLLDDSWAEPIKAIVPRKLARPPQFVCSGDRLFIMMGVSKPCIDPNSDRKFDLVLEVREVLIADNDTRTVAQITFANLKQMFGELSDDFHVAYGVPCINSEGLCTSLTLVSSLSGKILSYDLVSGSVDALPALSSLEEAGHDAIPMLFCHGKPMNLSLRILTSQELG